MSKTSKIILGVLLVVILLVGIGYAAIQNVTLNISGTASADPSQSNFKVMFSGTPTTSGENVTASITNDTNATINVTGLTNKGEIATATYTIQNTSSDLSANLSASLTNSNEEYFKVSQNILKPSIAKGEATTIEVKVELIKTPIATQVTSTVGVQISAAPVQPTAQ